MRKLPVVIVTAMALPLCACSDSTAPDSTIGNDIRGRISDEHGRAVIGAVVFLQHETVTFVPKSFDTVTWTDIPIFIEESGYVRFWIASFCDLDTVRVLIDGELQAGQHIVVWDGLDDLGRAVSDGIYWAHLDAPGHESRAPVAHLRWDYDGLDESTGVRPLAVTGVAGVFRIPQTCLPLGFTHSADGSSPIQSYDIAVSRRVKVWAKLPGYAWIYTDWQLVDEEEGVDVRLRFDAMETNDQGTARAPGAE